MAHLDLPTAAALAGPAVLAPLDPVRAGAAQRSRGVDAARRLGAAVLTTVLLGTAAGLLARELMRLITRAAGAEVQFTGVTTILVVTTFLVPMLPGAIAAAWQRLRLSRALVVAGAGFLLLESVVILLQEDPGPVLEQGGTAVASALLLVGALWALVVGYAVAVRRTSRLWGGRRAGTSS